MPVDTLKVINPISLHLTVSLLLLEVKALKKVLQFLLYNYLRYASFIEYELFFLKLSAQAGRGSDLTPPPRVLADVFHVPD